MAGRSGSAARTVRLAGMRAGERHGIAVIAQEPALVPEMSVAENLMLGREPVRRGLIQWERVRASAREALALVGSDVDPETPVRTLGVGQRQMVEIARALDKRSEILVLDEPTAALTETDARRLLGLLRGLRGRGVSSIYISHRLEEVFTIADRITVLRDGRTVATGPSGGWTPDRVIAAMVGREIRGPLPAAGELARARPCSRSRTGAWRTRTIRGASSSTACRSRPTRARCSGSRD